ncbi:DUF305 domain-containing protein [Streptomyces neyagawaensis]|uniref:DUF305 domain-containing protein n=1 Tax=Streptomyces neyagawaensis TaxID=42238 RepID=UPI0006E46A08|nr:DUF305 domain-containing protein [Streptomyces neyagawaensis]MCL6731265.1 DUF305 domain-containing protein [Streptomyces neyagawaensis]MDE1683611.1 DUF305 domain-containing protein [Streptomyces neyagawaensis]
MTASRGFLRRAALTVTAGAAALVLTACGGGDGDGNSHDMGSMASESGSPKSGASGKAGAGGHNKADVGFAEEMIQHHRQAVDMAELADSRAASPEVKKLATKIKGAQDPEIETMSGWLTAWGEKVPEDMAGMGHGMSSGMPGMMSAEDMADLEKASGAAFDEKFLKLMVEHHEGAVEMAETEQAEGKYAPAIDLAEDVITAQTAEIKQMNKMLDKS